MAELTSQATSPGCVFGNQAGHNNRKSEPAQDSAGTSPLCPQCHSKKVWRDALRYSTFGDKIQRWLCRECGLRFSDPNDVKKSWSAHEKAARKAPSNEIISGNGIVTTRQICVTETKNLVAEHQTIEVLRRSQTADAKGSIVEFSFWLLKQGYSKATIQGRVKLLNRLMRLGADFNNEDSIKEIIAKHFLRR